MLVPMYVSTQEDRTSLIRHRYNAELAPPGIRGSLVALQQLAITFGILISYWIGYGTNCTCSTHFSGLSNAFKG